MRKISSIMSIILVVCLSIGGVSAAWVYSTGAVDAVTALIENLSMGTWEFGYTVTFINNGKDLLVEVLGEPALKGETGTPLDLTTNEQAQRAAVKAEEQMGTGYEFSHWVNAGSTQIDTIPANNTEDVTLYPSFKNVYTAKFVDQEGNVLDWFTFSSGTTSLPAAPTTSSNPPVPTISGFDFNDEWEIHITNDKGETTNVLDYTLPNLTSCSCDVTIYPIYTYNGAASLNPVDSDGDGDTDYYEVVGIGDKTDVNITIPDNVNGIPVISIADNSFGNFDDVTDIHIPNTITSIGANAFADNDTNFIGQYKYETVQIYYDGTKEQWDAIEKPIATRTQTGTEWWGGAIYEYTAGWDTYLGHGSIIVCSDGYYLLNQSTNQNYDKNWEWHPHAHGTDCVDGCP